MIHSIYEAHSKLVKGEISFTEITQDCLKKALANKHNAIVSLFEDRALEKAEDLDKRFPAGKRGEVGENILRGIPYTLKDLFITKGLRTTAGSKMLHNYIPPYQGHTAAQLEKGEGNLIAKVGCDEFGMGSTNEYTPYGAITNPANPKTVAGGSSGGSAASVAEGSSFFSIGTDTGGSIRLPANFCGLTGMRPSYGRISRFGQISYASSLDQASPVARSVLDCSILMEALSVADEQDPGTVHLPSFSATKEVLAANSSDLKGRVLGYCPQFLESCTPEVQKALKQARDILSQKGVRWVEVDLPHAKYAVSVYYLLASSEASANLARYDGIRFGHRPTEALDLEDYYRKARSEGLGKEVQRRILLGTFSLSSGYHDAFFNKAAQVRRLIAEDFKKVFSKCDGLFYPVSTTRAFALGEGIQDSFKAYLNDMFTIPSNLAGVPSIALPFNGDVPGLPTGFQLMAPFFADKKLLVLAREVELALAKS